MELVHLDTDATKTSDLESVKRVKYTEIGDGRVSMKTSFGRPIANKIKEMSGTNAGQAFLPKVYDQVFDGKQIRVGVLEQDILAKIKEEFAEAKKSGVPAHVRMPANLLPLNVKVVNMIGEKTKIKISTEISPSIIYEEVKGDVLRGEDNMISEGIVPKIPLTPVNVYEILGDNVTIVHADTAVIKVGTASGDFDYRINSLKDAFNCAVAKIRMDGKEKDYVLSEYCPAHCMLAKLLPIRFYIVNDNGIIRIGGYRELNLDVDGRLLMVGAGIEKVLDVIKEKFNGARVVHCCSKSIQAVIYRWLEENSIVSAGMKKELGCYAVLSTAEKFTQYTIPVRLNNDTVMMGLIDKIENFRQILEESFPNYPGMPFSVHTSEMLSVRSDDMEERIISLWNTVYREISAYKLKYEVLRVHGEDGPEFIISFGSYQRLVEELGLNINFIGIKHFEHGAPDVKKRRNTGGVLVVLSDKWEEYFPRYSKDYLPINWQKLEVLCEALRERYKRFQLYFEVPIVDNLSLDFINDCRKFKYAISIAPFSSQAMRYWINISDTIRSRVNDVYDSFFQRPLEEGYGSLVKFFSVWYFGERMTSGSDLYKIPTKLWYYSPFKVRETLKMVRKLRRELLQKYPVDTMRYFRNAALRDELVKSYFYKVV